MARPPLREVVASQGKSPEIGVLPDALSGLVAGDRAAVLLWLNNQKPLTRAAYATDICGFFDHMAKPLADVSMEDMQGYALALGACGFKAATQARKIAAVKSLYTMSLKLGLLASNPAVLIQRPVSKDRLQERIVAAPAVMQLIDREPDSRNKLVLRVLYSGGLRISELCNLTWADLKARGKQGELSIFGKRQKTRSVTIGPNIWRELSALRAGAAPGDPVFRSRQGTPMDKASVHRVVKRAARRVGLPEGFSAHWLRHAHASHSLDAGANVHDVQATLGHASLNTTTKYAHSKRASSTYLPD